ncbi:helicase-related protein [Halorhodospira halophila]|uniref:helicase-related protein n=1 Tax=Halorhodospira halophila TaxID=1053 RepID=UPI001F5C7A15|nr:helicase-related protein [Halorhodospira halophila]
MEQYWLDRGISLRLSARLVHFREQVRKGRIHARIWSQDYRPLHAKIYLGDRAVTLGSSNFSRNGLERQHEANARFTATAEPRRYRETATIAQAYWEHGRDYTQGLLALLTNLLRQVTWREALARACAELLEGDWAREYLAEADLASFRALWPSQRQGIAQALYLLERQGAVLIADATGSGKTRMGAHLLRIQQGRLQGMGRLPRSTMITPKSVAREWTQEALAADAPLDLVREGLLSSGQQASWLEDVFRRTRLLAVDECHHFLNPRSQRTRRLFNHLADNVVLFTATPINRDADDLIRVAELLGADNLQESALEVLQRLSRRAEYKDLDPQAARQLRDEIRTFTVRRTKPMFNALIDREPDAYRDQAGRRCRYPEHRPRSYDLREPDADRTAAQRIRELLDSLYGVLHIAGTPLRISELQRRRGLSEGQYRDQLLAAAPALVRHRVLAALRSSRAAVVEHLCGTDAARSEFRIRAFPKAQGTGAMLDRLASPLPRPRNHLSVPLPEWLTDPDAWETACAHDRQVLAEVLEQVRSLSAAREQAKVERLLSLAAHHRQILAFDSCLITLAYLHDLLLAQEPGLPVWRATEDAGREAVLDAFRPGGEQRQGIALCSDSLAEGVNLQAASAVVHLDMPSVIRAAEQRTGRVDRMDSPHPEVEIWWPRDALEFALETDDRFIGRAETVNELLGGNLPLPEAFQRQPREPVDAQTLISEYESRAKHDEDGEPQDAFARVRGLVEGAEALVDPETYDYYRQRSVRVFSRVSVVESRAGWAFFCMAGGTDRAPRWFFFPGIGRAPLTDVDGVAEALRERLSEDPEDGELDEHSAELLGQFVDRLPEAEWQQLPLRKRRALEEMDYVLGKFQEQASNDRDQDRLDTYTELLNLLRRKPSALAAGEPDWDALAEGWLELIRPYWYQHLLESRGRGPMRLRTLRPALIDAERELGPQIRERFTQIPLRGAAEDRVIAAILGVRSR